MTESNKRIVFGSRPPSFPSLEVAMSAFEPGVPDLTPRHWETVAQVWSNERPRAQGLVEAWEVTLGWD